MNNAIEDVYKRQVKKVEIVEKYLNRELSQKGAAKMCGVNKRSVQDWIRIYKTDGPESLLSPKTNKRYSKELKLQAVHCLLYTSRCV